MGRGCGTSVYAPNHCVPSAPEGVWRWVVVVSATVISIFIGGLFSVNGMLYTALEAAYDMNILNLSWIGAIQSCLVNVAGLPAAFLTERLGCRVTGAAGGLIASTGYLISMTISNQYILYVTLGALPGLGLSLTLISSVMSINEYFVKLRPLAIAISISGGGVGVLLFPVMTTYFLETFGIKGTFLILGGLSLNCVCCGLSFRPVTTIRTYDDFSSNDVINPKADETPSNSTEMNSTKPYSVLKLLLYLFSVFLQAMSFYQFFVIIVDFVSYAIPSLSPNKAAMVLSTNGVTSIIGRLLAGVLCTAKPELAIQVKSFCLCLCGACSFGVTLCKSFVTMCIVVSIHGLAMGGYDSFLYEVLIQLVGVHRFPRFVGLLFLVLGIGGFVGQPAAVWLSDVSGEKASPFYMATACFTISSLCLLPLLIVTPCGTGKSITRHAHVDNFQKY